MTDPGNIARAEAIVSAAVAHGVRTWCVAPGGRNAPLVIALDRARGLDVIHHFEERSAAFFALGRARRDACPVAVVTTSGTAAAELLPAAIEARYAGVPLVLITADRPRRLRHTGAPQTIDQSDLLAPYAPTRLDLDIGEPLVWPTPDPIGPIHLNVAFDEPLLDATPCGVDAATVESAGSAATDGDELAALETLLATHRRPFLALGGLAPSDTETVRNFALALSAPLHADPTSQLRTDPSLAKLRLDGGDASVRAALREADAVIRIGAVPISRFWRDLDEHAETRPVVSLSRTGYPGLAHGTGLRLASYDALASIAVGPTAWDSTRLIDDDRARCRSLDGLLQAYPRSEPALIRALSATAHGYVYLGNSLPIREWGAFATRDDASRRIEASRGANGIDGQLSTFLGGCSERETSWAVLGDLTTLYDLAAPWVLGRIRTGPIRIVIVNNGGGRIFDRLFAQPALSNPHTIRFEEWASMWSLAYARYETWPEAPALEERTVIELVPDPVQTDAFWRAWADASR